uniref:Uncharacterized protein LOC111122878 isoform X1 n=1 Tax=Crassostrea virginica TaxID=6565 RepID=A0A8B8CZC6_CRAVI|nr:uncharacterized protein LOC111122878 isoform X1 [Crassostrea virginica]
MMSTDVELQNLVKVRVSTADGNEVQVTVPVVREKEISVGDIHMKACDCLGLNRTSSKWFSLFCGGEESIKRLSTGTFIHHSSQDIYLKKWCFNKEIEEQLIKDDQAACHLVYTEAKTAIKKGLLVMSDEQMEKLEEYDNPAFRLEEKYVQLVHSLKDYFSIMIKNCKISDKKINDGPLQVFHSGSVRISVAGIFLNADNFSTIIEWKHLKMWLIHRGLSQLTFLFVSPGDREGTVVIETCQCEYALAAILEIVKELQMSSPCKSFYYSSMISTNEEGTTSYENVLFSE